LSYSKDTIIAATARVTCGGQEPITEDCGTLKVDSVPGPIRTGELSFKKWDYKSNDTNYFFIGTRVDTSYIGSTLRIDNKEAAGCGNIRIRIDGNPAALNTPIKATAIVYCQYTDTLKLDSISAVVLPNPVIGECELTGDSKTTMRSDETLTLDISVDNNYGRCKKEYTLSSSSGNSGYGESNSFSLGDYGGVNLSNIYARVTCGSNTPVPKRCPTVNVTRYIKFEGCIVGNENRELLTFKRGGTTLEFACNSHKGDYYISCQGNRFNFSVEMDGYVEGSNDTNIRPNGGDNGYNFPNLETIKDGNLYRYPKPVIINNTSTGDIKCGIW